MKLKKASYHLKPPCSKCPYKSGVVHTFTNPCPQCKSNSYMLFEWFQKQIPYKHPIS